MVSDSVIQKAQAALMRDPMLAAMPEPMRRTFAFNEAHRELKAPQRWCVQCDRRYNIDLKQAHSRSSTAKEQWQSGICSDACFKALTGGQ